ncbi:Dyp-type peroxidase domain-containing protein [Flavobacterium nitrogenifigens]|nr:Dyp-type peroxidase domain-containing protein [Flavobacterium nitrogenifigens]
MVWKFKNETDIKLVFEKLCSLVSNLNNSYTIRIPDGRTSCVMGVGYDAWIRLGLPRPLPKELVNFEPIIGAKHTAKATYGDIHCRCFMDCSRKSGVVVVVASRRFYTRNV